MTKTFSVVRFLRKILLDQQKPCFLLLDQNYRLLRLDGDADYYGFGALRPGDDCRVTLPFLYGLAPDEAIHLPLVETTGGRGADLLLAPLGANLGVLLTDASRERASRQVAQQQANEIRLLYKEQQKLVEEMRAARDESDLEHQRAEDASRTKSRFIASLSHELRTPLTGILGHAALLADPKQDIDTLAESARLIESNANHLLSLVDNVLDQASLEMGQLALRPVPVRLSSLCREIRAMFAPIALKRGLDFKAFRRCKAGTAMEVDVTRLRQVVINIVDNAIKYTASGIVVVIFTWEQDRLEVAVSDSGPGIPRCARSRVFLPFHREKGADAEQGAGLGLAISARLVTLMGGSLELEDRPGGGSVFRFSISAPGISAVTDSEGMKDNTGRRILLVDDNADIRALYTRLLERRGFVVDAAEDEPEAWSCFEANRPDVVIVDLYLTEWEGSGLVRRLRGRGFNGGVLAWSASSLQEDGQGALDAGADAFLMKPVDIGLMCATVNDILHRGGSTGE